MSVEELLWLPIKTRLAIKLIFQSLPAVLLLRSSRQLLLDEVLDRVILQTFLNASFG